MYSSVFVKAKESKCANNDLHTNFRANSLRNPFVRRKFERKANDKDACDIRKAGPSFDAQVGLRRVELF